MPVIPHLFSLSGLAAGAMLLYSGVAAALLRRLVAGVRSLKIEHVSPELVVLQEICRCTPPGRPAGRTCPCGAALRRRPRMRKPDAGFLLTGIPATLLVARRFDAWLEAGAELLIGGLTAVASGSPAATR